MVMPVARMINAARKNGNEGILAAGKKARHATTMVSSPTTMALLYPIQSIIFDAGMEKTKYAEKKAVWTNMLAASSILKTCWTYGIRTSFKEVSEPHIKKSVVSTARAPVYAAEDSLVAVGLLTLIFSIEGHFRPPAGFAASPPASLLEEPILHARAQLSS